MSDLANYHTAVDRGLVLLVRSMVHIMRDARKGMGCPGLPVPSCQAAT